MLKSKNHIKDDLIVITPVRDGAWVLDKFLSSTLMWADRVIVGLDNCSDNSAQICEKYDKVSCVIVKAKDQNITERPNRRQLLLEHARKFNSNAIICALDVDEIFSAEILEEKNLRIIRSVAKGAAFSVRFRELWFNPFLYRSEKNSNWSGRLMPCIWRDDGTDYEKSDWHEARCPISISTTINLDLLHFARLVPVIYFSRMRHYILRDVIQNQKNVWITNYIYSSVYNEQGMELSVVPSAWYGPYIKKDNNFLEFKDTVDNWYNKEILLILNEHKNSKLLYKCDIWDFNWESLAAELDFKLVPLDKKRIVRYKSRRDYIRKNFKLPFYSIEYFRVMILRFVSLFRKSLR